MYAGKIIETAKVRELFNNPAHPYTAGLINSLPQIDRRVERLYAIRGQPPSLLDLPDGCSFYPRCSQRKDICRLEYPPAISVADGHSASCWKLKEK